jgi:hypothetical protein
MMAIGAMTYRLPCGAYSVNKITTRGVKQEICAIAGGIGDDGEKN